MNMVILDGAVINPGDLSWESFEAFASVTVYERTHMDDVVKRAHDAEIVITNKTPLSAKTIEQLPNLRYIGIVATGYDVVDIEAAAKRNIPVCNVVAYGVDTVAQHVMALLLELTRGISDHSQSVKSGDWNNCIDWCYWLKPLRDLSEMRMGIVGFGNIGHKVGHMAHVFGMQVQAYNRSPKTCDEYPCSFADLDTIFRTSDVISLHCPLNDESRNLVDAKRLASMKPGSIIINTARGPLLNEADVAEALHSGQLGGLGVDVLSTEPPAKDNPLLSAPNCLITPHISWATRKARANILRLAAENIQAWVNGKAQNVVNKHFFSQ